MYICICNGVTESEVRSACRSGARTLEDLQDSLGVATGCGQCAGDACAVLEGQEPGLAAAPVPSCRARHAAL